MRLNEIKTITKSLSALEDVISVISRNDESHIPYRNHILTKLLSDSLGHGAKTVVYVNVSPKENDLEETQNSLSYASRLMNAQQDAQVWRKALREAEVLKKEIQYWSSIDKSEIKDMISIYM